MPDFKMRALSGRFLKGLEMALLSRLEGLRSIHQSNRNLKDGPRLRSFPELPLKRSFRKIRIVSFDRVIKCTALWRVWRLEMTFLVGFEIAFLFRRI